MSMMFVVAPHTPSQAPTHPRCTTINSSLLVVPVIYAGLNSAMMKEKTKTNDGVTPLALESLHVCDSHGLESDGV